MATITRKHQRQSKDAHEKGLEQHEPLLYAAEPILMLEDGSLPLAGVELLYRGEGTPPDAELLSLLARHRVAHCPIHINLDTRGILETPEALIEGAASYQQLVIEWREVPHYTQPLVRLAGEVLERWRTTYGIKIAIDDLGSGIDAIGRAAAIKGGPDMFKVGVTLFHTAFRDRSAKKRLVAIVKALQEASVVVIEGIETNEHYRFAQRLGVAGQGFMFPASPVRFIRVSTDCNSVCGIIAQ